jgi:GT2 family glycosyltransferase
MSVSTAVTVSVIVVSYNTREILRVCLESLYAGFAAPAQLEVIVIDNASRDASAEMVAADFPAIHLIRSDSNLGFAAANNLGFQAAHGRYIVLLNPDTQLGSGVLQTAISHMDANPSAGLAGGRLIDRDGHLQPSARVFPSLLNEFLVLSGLAARFPASRLLGRFDRTWADPMQAAEVDWVPGAFTIIRHDALHSVGPFDERYFLYYEEVDLCRRFKMAGWQVWYWPEIEVRHWGGESSKTVENVEFNTSGSQLTLWRMRSGLLYYRKHHGQLTAWLVASLEQVWHRLRGFRARLTAGSDSAKAQESKRIVQLMQRAWQETAGGRISPPRPW